MTNVANRRSTIFLIEDDEGIRSTFKLCLEMEGYDVEAYEDGRAALARLHQVREPCLILLDFMMPVMNGMEFMLEFSKLPATVVPVPVYLCSASASLNQSHQMGCAGFLKKPVDLEVLLKIVRDYCAGHSEIST